MNNIADKDDFEIIREINQITLEIELHYPELYKTLDETPFKPKYPDGEKPNSHALFDYLVSLRGILSHYKETHKPV